MGGRLKRAVKSRETSSDLPLPLADAIASAKKGATAKFDEAIEVAIRLGLDTRNSDQNLRGVVAMPAGTGKNLRVAALCEGGDAKLAAEAGADIVGCEDLLEQIGAGKIEFDILVATPGVMPRLGQHGRVLGPKGLMPNPKSGTVSADIGAAVGAAKAGQVQFRADKGGNVHAAIGRASFSAENLERNFVALLDALKKAKPPAAKGQYLRSATLTSTMGTGVPVDVGPLR